MSNTQQRIQVGPATAYLLNALRAVENARENYYLGMDAMGGDELAESANKQVTPAFEAVQDIIEKEIIDNIRTWAMMTNPSTEI